MVLSLAYFRCNNGTVFLVPFHWYICQGTTEKFLHRYNRRQCIDKMKNKFKVLSGVLSFGQITGGFEISKEKKSVLSFVHSGFLLLFVFGSIPDALTSNSCPDFTWPWVEGGPAANPGHWLHLSPFFGGNHLSEHFIFLFWNSLPDICFSIENKHQKRIACCWLNNSFLEL